MRHARGVWAAAILAAGMLATIGADTPDPVMGKAAAAAVRASEAWRGVVAREDYVQHMRTWLGMPPTAPGRGPAVVTRIMVADLLLVYDANGPWELHRDV